LRITCLYPDSGRIIVDCWDDTSRCFASGVDSASITIIVTIDGDSAEDVTSECAIVSSFVGYRITWEYEDLPYSERLLFCVDASDLAGNAARTFCKDWTICDEDTVEPDTVDICPPVIGLEYPLRITCLYPDSGRIIVDCWDTDTGRCIATGVDSSSITVTVTIDGDSAEDVTNECAIVSSFVGYRITWEYEDLPYSERLLFCVDASDLAGNAARTFCEDWTICDEPDTVEPDTVDICPPAIGLEYPWRITCLYPDSGRIIVDCWDIDTGRCFASGVDSSSITVTVTIDGDSAEDVTSECAIVLFFGMYRITWEYEDLPYGESLLLCVNASDLAGNSADTLCEYWTICDEPDTVDLCPPVIRLGYPLRITSLYPDSGRIIVDCLDPDTGRCFASGVDSSGITVTVTIDGYTPKDVTSECAIDSRFGGYRITWEYEDLPYDKSLLFSVRASDLANNIADTFYTFSGEWIYDTSLLILSHPTINVYPNPFNKKCDILIHSPIEPLTGVYIYDIFGKQVEKFGCFGVKTNSYRLEWDGSAHPSGIYMIRATAGGYDRVMRILLIK
jgi:hypothetical protein